MTNFGPEWFWDQTRPEAIEARRQMAEFVKKTPCFALSRRLRGELELLACWSDYSALMSTEPMGNP